MEQFDDLLVKILLLAAIISFVSYFGNNNIAMRKRKGGGGEKRTVEILRLESGLHERVRPRHFIVLLEWQQSGQSMKWFTIL